MNDMLRMAVRRLFVWFIGCSVFFAPAFVVIRGDHLTLLGAVGVGLAASLLLATCYALLGILFDIIGHPVRHKGD